MGLRFDPIGGGQFKQAVKQIMDAERQPVHQLEGHKSIEQARLKLFQEFKGKFSTIDKTLQDFTNFKRFRELKADLGDGDKLVSVTLDKDKAEPGSYELEIDQLAARSSIISNGFQNPDEPNLGMGYVVMDLPNGDSAEVFVDEDKASLRGIANAINSTADAPVRASVIRDGSDPEAPYRLIVSAKSDGVEQSVDFPDFYFIDGDEDLYIDDNHDAQNAQISVNGFQIEAAGNDIKDFLQGVNLHLKQARPDEPFMLTITQDYQKISGKMKSLVDQVNGVLDFINKQNQIDEKSDTRSTFAGDAGLQTIEYRLRNLIHEGFPVGDPDDEDKFHWVFLSQLGVEFDKTGALSFKEDKFTKAMEGDFDGIAEAITGKHGFANQLREVISGYTSPGTGLLALREQGIQRQIKNYDEQIAEKEARLDQREQNLTNQFARLEASLSNMQRQSQYLAATLPGASGGNNLVSQLLGG